MAKPRISWMPVRLMGPIISEKSMTLQDWLRSAPDFDVDGVEIHYKFLESREESYLREIYDLVKSLGLEVSMLACSPDFIIPDPYARDAQQTDMEMNIEAAKILHTDEVRITTGQRHPRISDEQGIALVVDTFLQLHNYAEPVGVRLALENHYREPFVWDLPDFANRTAVFLKLYEEIKDTPIMINFDCSNPLINNEDPVALLEKVKEKVISVHASDRLPGQSQHTIIGEGAAPYDKMFTILADNGFAGWISAVDGSPEGDEGLKRSIDFLRKKVEEYWPG